MKKCIYQEITPKGYYNHCNRMVWFRPLLCVGCSKCDYFKPTVLYRLLKVFKKGGAE